MKYKVTLYKLSVYESITLIADSEEDAEQLGKELVKQAEMKVKSENYLTEVEIVK
jgi:hypothetical protein